MIRQLSVKPKTDTESADVYVAGISAKVKVHYPGRSHLTHESETGKKNAILSEAKNLFFQV